jgi:hypothetical protein
LAQTRPICHTAGYQQAKNFDALFDVYGCFPETLRLSVISMILWEVGKLELADFVNPEPWSAHSE